MRRMLAVLAAASLVLSCAPAATPSPAPSLPPVTVAPSSPAPTAASWLRLEWEAVDPPALPENRFMTNVLSSERGLLLRVLARPDSKSISVQTTTDGRSWTATTAPPDSPLGYSVDGLGDWLQLMVREGDDPGMDLLASTDGVTWTLRSRLPEAFLRVSEKAVLGHTIVACGAQKDMSVSIETCAVSTDEGATWRHLPELDPVVGSGKFLGVTATSGGFLLSVRLDVGGTVMGGGAVSVDGITWDRLAPAPGLQDLVPDISPRVAAVGDRHVITGAVLDGREHIRGIWTTTDGRSWQRVGLPRVVGWAGELYAAPDFGVATAGEGNDALLSGLFVSAAGETWRADEIPAALAGDYEWQWRVERVGEALLFLDELEHGAFLAHGVPTADPGPTPAPPATEPPEPSGDIPPELAWETATIQQAGHVNDVAAWSGGLVAVGDTYTEADDSLTAIWTSPDGGRWTLLAQPRLSWIGFRAVAAGAGRLVAAGTEFTPFEREDRAVDAVFWYSDDGRSWTRAPDADDGLIGLSFDDTVDTGIYDLAAWHGGFVAVGGVRGMPTKPAAWYSEDGVTWTRVQVPGAGAMMSVAAPPDALVAVGSTGGPESEGRVWRSEDGRTWELLETPAAVEAIHAASDGELVVATGWRTGIWSSTDGLRWAAAPDQPSLLPETFADRIWTVASGPSGFVACGSRTCPDVAGLGCPAAWTSADALRWARFDLPTETLIEGGSQLRMLPMTSVWQGDRLIVIGGYEPGLMEQGWRVWIGRPDRTRLPSSPAGPAVSPSAAPAPGTTSR